MSQGLSAETEQHLPGEGKSVAWYRTPIDRKLMQQLHERSDAKGLVQAVGHLLVLAATGILAGYSAYHWRWWATLPLVYFHGMCWAFLVNGMHELGHGTVFRTRWMTNFFVHLYSFLGWINHEMFAVSHARHHRYTLHPPDDLEVVLPFKVLLSDFLRYGIVNVMGPYHAVRGTWQVARGRFEGEWFQRCFPADEPEKRQPAVRWARVLLIGHGAIVVVSLIMHWWMVPVLVTLAPFYGTMLQASINHTQHMGLQDNVDDFRLCCRTIMLNPFVEFLYWQMNYHTEHHMYAAVPCYNLAKLHKAIKHDMPPCPNGILAAWRQILQIVEKQKVDPTYQYQAPVPPRPEKAPAAPACAPAMQEA